MSATAETQILGAACRRLLALVEEQVAALESADLERFEVLFVERAALQRLFEDTPVGGLDPTSRALLEQVADLDRRTLGRARELLGGTAHELRQLRRSRAAVGGYARPGLHLRDRPALLDQAG